MKRRKFIQTLSVSVAALESPQFIPLLTAKSNLSSGKPGMRVRYETKTLNLKHTWTIARNINILRRKTIIKTIFLNYALTTQVFFRMSCSTPDNEPYQLLLPYLNTGALSAEYH